jgi:hypothetical protein
METWRRHSVVTRPLNLTKIKRRSPEAGFEKFDRGRGQKLQTSPGSWLTAWRAGSFLPPHTYSAEDVRFGDKERASPARLRIASAEILGTGG